MASGSSSLDNLTNLYKHVIDDVIRNMREEYLNGGTDTELLEELKQLWLHKLSLTGAVGRPSRPDPPPRPPVKESPAKPAHKLPSNLLQVTSSPSASASSPSSHLGSSTLPPPPPLTSAVSTPESVIHHAPPQTTPSFLPSNSPSISHHSRAQTSSVQQNPPTSSGVIPQVAQNISGQQPPPPPLAVSTATNLAGLTPAVNPFSAMQNLRMVNPTVGQMNMIPVQTQQGTMLVPLQAFLSLSQMKQQATPSSSSPSTTPTSSSSQKDNVVQLDGLPPQVDVSKPPSSQPGNGTKQKSKICGSGLLPSPDGPSSEVHSGSDFRFQIIQLDGSQAGAGGQEESSSDDDSDLDDDSSEDEPGPEQNEACGSPLNSGDDLEDDDDGDVPGEGDFETQDNIVCQWEKVYRVKNKWKFQLKDGIMHVGGHDYVFQKVTGEADW